MTDQKVWWHCRSGVNSAGVLPPSLVLQLRCNPPSCGHEPQIHWIPCQEGPNVHHLLLLLHLHGSPQPLFSAPYHLPPHLLTTHHLPLFSPPAFKYWLVSFCEIFCLPVQCYPLLEARGDLTRVLWGIHLGTKQNCTTVVIWIPAPFVCSSLIINWHRHERKWVYLWRSLTHFPLPLGPPLILRLMNVSLVYWSMVCFVMGINPLYPNPHYSADFEKSSARQLEG